MRKVVALALCLPLLLWGGRVSYDDLCGYGKIEVGAGLVALRPSTCKIEYAIDDPREFTPQTVVGVLPEGRARSIHPEFELGVRALIGYGSRYGCTDVRTEYTYLHSRHINTANANPSLWPTLAHPAYLSLFAPLIDGEIPAFDRVKSKFDYDAVDLQFGLRSKMGKCLFVRAYAGLHFLNLGHNLIQDMQGVTPASPVGDNVLLFEFWNDKRCSWGIGPLVGFDAQWKFYRSLSLTGHVGMGLLSGEARWRRIEQLLIRDGDDIQVEQDLSIKRRHCDQLTPYLRGSLGLSYLLCVPWSYRLIGEFAYEFHSYINGTGLFRFNDMRGTGVFARGSFNLDGLVLMVRLVV